METECSLHPMELPLLVSSTEQAPITEITSQNSLKNQGFSDENGGRMAIESHVHDSEISLTSVSCTGEADHVTDLSYTTQRGVEFRFFTESNNHNIRPSIPPEEPGKHVTISVGLLESVVRELCPHRIIPKTYKPPQCSIYTIPLEARRRQPEAYKPKVVRIGLYYHHDSETKEMRDCKWRCFHVLVSRLQKQEKKKKKKNDSTTTKTILIGKCLEMIQKNREWIESYYSDAQMIKLDEGVLILDCCFILYLLLQLPQVDVDDRLWVWQTVKYDLLLLENQIPFFLLYEMRDIIGTVEDKNVDLIQRALDLFRDIEFSGNESFLCHQGKRQQQIKVHHLLHLFYLSLLPSSFFLLDQQEPAAGSTETHRAWIPCATNLAELGVEFRKREKHSLLDVKFTRKGITRKGVMEIPPLLIGDHSRDLFCNLIVFEQCCPHSKCHIAAYASFMDCIVNNEMDIMLLCSTGIVTNRMSVDQGMTHFFSRLNTGMHLSSNRFFLAGLFSDVNKFKQDKWNKSWAGFRHAYCPNVWAVFAALVGVIFFLLTVIQTIYTVLSYYHPKGS